MLSGIPPEVARLIEAMGGERAPLLPLTAPESDRFPGLAVRRAMFSGCAFPAEAFAGALLLAGRGAEGHEAAQATESVEGAYWHGIFHRMEPDPWNAKYWFRRAEGHAIETDLLAAARGDGWDAGPIWRHDRFVDFIEGARSGGDAETVLKAKRIQMAELRLLFAHCAKEIT